MSRVGTDMWITERTGDPDPAEPLKKGEDPYKAYVRKMKKMGRTPISRGEFEKVRRAVMNV